MVKLRDYFSSDLSLFLNTDEFATVANIGGYDIKVVLDSDKLVEKKLKNGGEGLAESELLFHVSKTDLPFEPFTGQDIKFNGNFYFVDDVQEDEGLYTITLVVHQS